MDLASAFFSVVSVFFSSSEFFSSSAELEVDSADESTGVFAVDFTDSGVADWVTASLSAAFSEVAVSEVDSYFSGVVDDDAAASGVVDAAEASSPTFSEVTDLVGVDAELSVAFSAVADSEPSEPAAESEATLSAADSAVADSGAVEAATVLCALS